jgi:hypothetical protein
LNGNTVIPAAFKAALVFSLRAYPITTPGLIAR